MSIGLLFWILMVLWLIFGLYPAPSGNERHWAIGGQSSNSPCSSC